jgi:hypothetical protein
MHVALNSVIKNLTSGTFFEDLLLYNISGPTYFCICHVFIADCRKFKLKKYDAGITYNDRSKSIFMEICHVVPNLKWGQAS